jgi:hypothetical protein
LSGKEMVHMMCKGQAKYACNPQPSLAEQFDLLVTRPPSEAHFYLPTQNQTSDQTASGCLETIQRVRQRRTLSMK